MISPKRKKEFQKLVKKYQQGKATPEEKDFIEKYYQYFNKEERITASLSLEEKTNLENRLLQKITDNIPEKEHQSVPLYRKSFSRIAVAAAILLLIGAGSYLLFFNQSPKQIASIPKATDVEAPKVTKATITLDNGRAVSLDSLTTLTQYNVNLVKTTEGRIVYLGNANEIIYNTLTNPRGSKVIDIQLSDGSRLWLNAGSSVTYPVAFIGNERKVQITGEAYFEIAHDETKPFLLTKGDMQVQVIGTHFNVNAYDDENDIKVTLLEGAVKVSNGINERLLKPGQQAQIITTGNSSAPLKVTSNIDIETVMAWKNGLFSFDNADLPTVMRQLSRWYDIEVEYAGKIPEGRFEGKILRDLSLSQLLSVLTSTRIHFKMEGNNKIIILPG